MARKGTIVRVRGGDNIRLVIRSNRGGGYIESEIDADDPLLLDLSEGRQVEYEVQRSSPGTQAHKGRRGTGRVLRIIE